MSDKFLQIQVDGKDIDVIRTGDDEYISLTAMVKGFGGNQQIQNWLRTKDTINFLGVWEKINNPNFNSIEFDRIRLEAGASNYILSVKEWTSATDAIGVASRAGRYGGTFAHKDIAFEFASWLSPVFKLLLITEFQRLKERENANDEWDFKRFLSKANYKLHSNTVKEVLIPELNVAKNKEWLVYANEADILNKIVFGQTAAEWKRANPELAKGGKNQRDYASAKKLLILANIEAINANLLSRHVNKEGRAYILYNEARRQAASIDATDFDKSIAASGIERPRLSIIDGDSMVDRLSA